MNNKQLQEYHKIDLSSYKGNQRKDKILRNLVEKSVGKMIFECSNNTYQKDTKQIKLF